MSKETLRKRCVIGFILLAILLFVYEVGFKSAGEKYVGIGQGYGGEIKVEVAVNNKKIGDIKVLKQNETSFTKDAISSIIKSIVETQSLDVDSIAGATATSNGLKEAVKNAIKDADVVLSTTVKRTNKVVDVKDIKTDVVVIGAGGAGLSAAISAKENGVDVIVLEKMPIMGGNTNYATGGMNAANTKLQKKLGIKDTEDLFYNDTMKGGKNKNNPVLLRKMVDESKNAIDWIIEKGADITEISFSGGQSVKRIHRPTGGKAIGPVVMDTLQENIDKIGVEVRTNNEVVKILKNANGEVTGVVVKTEGKEYTIEAKAVIVATGGFGANPEMVSKYNPKLKGFGTTNSKAITGEGIMLVEEIGGALVDMNEIQTHPTVVHQKADMITESVRGEGAILVNRAGKRFINELQTRDVVSKAELEQEGKSAFLVFDQGTRENLSAIEKYVKKGLTKQADTLDELAKITGVDAKELEKTVTKYNGFVKNGKDEEFGKKGLPREIIKAPFYSIEVSPAVHHTMGGVKINENAEVIDTKGKIIKGLFAAGEVVGGVHGGNRIGGNAISDIIVFGIIAGKNAAVKAK